MRIRPATPGDVDGIARVAEAAWYEAHAPIAGADAVAEFLEEYYDRESLLGRVESDDWLVLVAADDGDVVGFAAAQPVDEAGLYGLTNLYVAPDHWREGIGSRLLDRVEAAVAERGASRLRLAVMAENERAVAFYRGAGFELVDEGYDERLGVERDFYAKNL